MLQAHGALWIMIFSPGGNKGKSGFLEKSTSLEFQMTNTRPSSKPCSGLFLQIRLSLLGFTLRNVDTQQMLKYSLQHLWKPNFKFILGKHLQQCCLESLFLFSDRRMLCLTNAFHCADGEGQESWSITFESF